MTFEVFIFAGGQSRRFGSDKALAELDGEPLIVRLARAAAPFASSLRVVAERADKYAALGLPTIADTVPERGPLGGLLTALERLAPERWALVLSCDQVVLQGTWVEALARGRGAASAVAFRGERWQPFPGLYQASLAARVREAVRGGDLRLSRLLDGVGATPLPLPPDWPAVPQVNTQAALDALRRGGR